LNCDFNRFANDKKHSATVPSVISFSN
jgi:hypothetical protein